MWLDTLQVSTFGVRTLKAASNVAVRFMPETAAGKAAKEQKTGT